MRVGRCHVSLIVAFAVALFTAPPDVAANPDSGIDANLYRPALDATGTYTLDGGSTMSKGGLSVSTAVGFGDSPLNLPVPGIGGVTDKSSDSVLKFAVGLHLGIGFAVTNKLTIGVDVGAYRTQTDAGFGERGRYRDNTANTSTGLQSLRPISNIDPAGGFLPEQLAGPLDTRIGIKYRLTNRKRLHAAVIGIFSLPFGDETMFLGDANAVFEPKLAVDYWLTSNGRSRLLLNLAARLRQRTVLEAYNPNTQTDADAQVVFDLGSEIVAGVGFKHQLLNQLSVGVEATFLAPLPPSLTWGTCRQSNGDRCTSNRMNYFANDDHGDPAAFSLVGLNYRVSAETAVTMVAGMGLYGARREGFRVMSGVVWRPMPEGSVLTGSNDKDGDGIPDAVDICPLQPEDKDNYRDEDGCPELDNDGDGVLDAKDKCVNEPEDRDGFQDDDGCPEDDNDRDGVSDITDQCPNKAEDKDGFEDDDGCPDEDNDGDGFADSTDKCPNSAETVNGYRDNDGCPDVPPGRIRLAHDRIDMRGGVIRFASARALTKTSRSLLNRIAALIKRTQTSIRVEVHVARSYRGRVRWRIKRAQNRDKRKAQRRARIIVAHLLRQGVPAHLVRDSGVGSGLGLSSPAWDQSNERVEFIRVTTSGLMRGKR